MIQQFARPHGCGCYLWPNMKNPITLATSLLLLIGSTQLHAQFGGSGGLGGSSAGPQLNPRMLKLFGEHKAFSADIKFQVVQSGQAEPMTLPGKMAVQDKKSRFEMNLLEAQGGGIPANAAAQLKQFGMDSMVIISLPEKKVSCILYPGLKSYVELPMDDEDTAKTDEDFTLEITEAGKETVNGQECIKNKVLINEKDGTTHEATTWNATELEKFPIKIETTEEGNQISLLFSEVKLTKPAASAFEAPSGYTKYDDMMSMMQGAMLKNMGGGGMPGGN